MKFDIVCFGSGLIDIFAETNVHDNGKVMSYPIGAKIQIKDLNFDIGGGGVNTSTTFSKIGLKTAFLGNIGEDDFAKKILDKLKKEKVSFIGENKGKTGYSIVLDSKEHDRTILTYKGDNDFFEGNGALKINTSWFYFSSLAHKSFETQLRIAKSKKFKIAFNPSLYLFKEENVKSILPYVNILVLNKEEADMITKDHKNILKNGPEILIVTDGKNPFYCYTNKQSYKIYPHHGIKVVERTGAGDAFASAFVASHILGKNVGESLQIALANSESVVKQKGATNGVLTISQAEKIIRENPARIDLLR